MIPTMDLIAIQTQFPIYKTQPPTKVFAAIVLVFYQTHQSSTI